MVILTSSAAQLLRVMHISDIFILRVIHESVTVRRALRLLAKHLESTFSSTSH